MLVPELIRRKSRVVKTLWLRLIERRGFAHASAIHFTSQLEWEDAKRVGIPLPSPIVVPNGVDVRAAPRRPARRAHARLPRPRELEEGTGARDRGAARAARARLIVAGNDEENLTPRLRALAESRRRRDRVEFPGPVYGAAKDELLARATLFVLLSDVGELRQRRARGAGDGDAGRAVDRRRAGGRSRARGRGRDRAGRRAGVARRSRPRARQMGRNGRALVESRFAWPRVAQEMEEAYCSIRSRR